ncbi:MAG TPA: PadR family transcriptional regulator [Armatimonadetes bacterium]|nr:PadR family transcriptional regulator [Armatimonadota bacterium]
MGKDFTAAGYWNGLLNASLCKLFILRALREGPGHGYEIAQRVKRLTEGFCVPTDGTIYPALHEFEECGCITCRSEIVAGRTRKVYTLTEKGHEAYRAGKVVWQKGLGCMDCVVGEE